MHSAVLFEQSGQESTGKTEMEEIKLFSFASHFAIIEWQAMFRYISCYITFPNVVYKYSERFWLISFSLFFFFFLPAGVSPVMLHVRHWTGTQAEPTPANKKRMHM